MFQGRIIDLSQEIYQGMPVYPGHLKTVIWTHLSHEECQRQLGTNFSYETRGILLCDHGPTHIDAVNHLSRDPNAESIDQLALEKCITSAICIDVSDVLQKTQFGPEKIEDELRKRELDIREGDTVLFYTGQYDKYYGKPEY
ncbi:cyclase family protein, partial [Chloroflexota bacterium]